MLIKGRRSPKMKCPAVLTIMIAIMPMITPHRLLCLIASLAGLPCVAVVSADQPVDFNRDVRPILSNKCFSCHGPDEGTREAGLRLDDSKVATKPLESGRVAIVPGIPEKSELIRRIVAADDDERMPPADSGKSLTAAEIATLRQWVREGSHYALHWSYVKPAGVAPPALPEKWQEWPRNDIDRFALSAMIAHNLEPSPEADRYTLVRRVFLDLTGLPPSVDEVDQFVKDTDPQAYEKLVDNLLHRSSYGEHWARAWLDLARYADSAGYADDPPRTIWAYRDWVIKAINDNQPFDQFTIDQIAGDLLPNPTEGQLVATAFHRNTLTNSEGGTQDEEFRNAAVVDRVNTTMAVWMGTTMACAQCHTHKFDPITQREYFELFAVLNNTEDSDRKDESPVLPIYTDELIRNQLSVLGRITILQAILRIREQRGFAILWHGHRTTKHQIRFDTINYGTDTARACQRPARNAYSTSRQLPRQGACRWTRPAQHISAGIKCRTSESPESCALARRQRQSADRASGRESILGGCIWARHCRNQ